MWSLGSAEVVCGLDYQLKKSDQVVTEIYVGFEFEVMASESLHCWQGDRWAKMRKHTSIGLMQMTFKLTQQPNRCGQSQSSEAWHWPSFHCDWGYISFTVHCSSLDFWSSWHFEQSRASFSFSQGNIYFKCTRDALVVSTYLGVTMLIRQSCRIMLTAVQCMDKM